MTNPTPRPALRKAEDADVHPAAPRPVRSPRAPRKPAPRDTSARAASSAATGTTRSTAAADAAPAAAAPTKRTRAFSGSTSDAVRMPDVESAPSAEPARRSRAAQQTSPQGTAKAGPEGLTTDEAAKLMTGKTVVVEVHLPKRLRKAAAAEAKARGLDVDAVVADLLHAWLTARH
jgi:hypothetical protein